MIMNNILFDAQNAGNCISELLNFKSFWGSMPPIVERLAPFVAITACSTFSTYCTCHDLNNVPVNTCR